MADGEQLGWSTTHPEAASQQLPAVRSERIDDLVALWHDSDTDESLHDWLGWSWAQYKAWVEGERSSSS